nr:MAG TPA: acetyltransferase domain containing protein [Caudoviricetes sp.]
MENDKIEIIVYKPKGVEPGDMRGSSIISALASQSPEILSFLCMCEYFRMGKDVRAAKLSAFKNFNIVDFIKKISSDSQDRNYLILIAKYEDRVVGELISFLDAWGVSEPTLKSLYVETQYRKKGVAKALVSKLIEETEDYLKDNHIWERKYPYISTLILDYNKPAIKLLEKLGFIPFQRKGCVFLKKDIKIKEDK